MGLINNIKSIVSNNTISPQPVPTVPTAQPAPKKKILIAEDDPTMREFYGELMNDQGYEVYTAENGQIALQMAIEKKPDLLILDIMMPIMDGKAMLHELRKIPQFKLLPVIILTNAGDTDTMRETQRYENADAFLIKSNVTPQEVIDKVKFLI